MSHENVFMNTWVEPTAKRDSKLFCLPSHYLRQLAMHPKGRDTWMAMLVTSMAVIAERPVYEKLGGKEFGKGRVSNQEDLHPDYFDLENHRSHLFDPLKAWETPDPLAAGSGQGCKHLFGHIWYYMKSSFERPWPCDNFPTGLRHQLLPPIKKKTASDGRSSYVRTVIGENETS